MRKRPTKEWSATSGWPRRFALPPTRNGSLVYDGALTVKESTNVVVHLRLPDRTDVCNAFFSFDASGKLVPYGGESVYSHVPVSYRYEVEELRS